MFEVEYYQLADGTTPVADWLGGLADERTVDRVTDRIDRLAQGNPGDHKAIGDGLAELRLDFGPGYRLYYARVGRRVVLLLCGGDKSTQKRDIKLADRYLADYRERTE
jgi:putative addiction module killer protein